MQVDQITFRRLVSFGNYNNEEFGVVVNVDEGDDWDEAMDSARVLVSEALKRSQTERDWQEAVNRTKFAIASNEHHVKRLFDYLEANPDESKRLEGELAGARMNLAKSKSRLALLQEVGPVEGWQECIKEEDADVEREQAADADEEDNDYSDDPHDDNWYDTGE